MNSLIPVMNELQNVFKSTGTDEIDLPQIVVIGSQSCGKSSVLESLVGKSFLPRGTGIVTRCPTILQLIHVDNLDTENNNESNEWCTFPSSDDPYSKYSNFDEVREEIEKKTNRLAGNNKGICMEPILIRMHSPDVINLTVVDLPGVVKVALGDQPSNIEEQVRNLIMYYISKPNAIILAVSPANADIATSESIKIAKEVDPNGNRTLAVITKLDLMDKGTDATKVLSGDVIQVKLGIVGVVNRSQYDINNSKSIEIALEDEETFFRKMYPQHTGVIGSSYLGKRLQQLLMKHIQESLPDLIKRIMDLTDIYELNKQELGEAVPTGTHEKHWFMMQIVNNFLLHYKSAINERPPLSSEYKELFALQIAEAYEKFSKNLISKDYLLGDDLDEKILLAIRNSANIERFTSNEHVFKALAKQHIMLMEKPCIDCAVEVHTILSQAVDNCLKDERMETLNLAIGRIAKKVLHSQLQQTKIAIKEHMQIQSGMIFSSDADFLNLLKISEKEEEEDAIETLSLMFEMKNSVSSATFPLRSTIHKNDMDDDNQCQHVNNLITVYFSVVRRQIADYMPKHMMYHLYECTMKKLLNAIKEATAGRENDLISEPENTTRKRKETGEMLENLYQAIEIIGEIQSTG